MHEPIESTEACAEPKEVVAEPLPAISRAGAGTIDAEEQALPAKCDAYLAQLRQQKRRPFTGLHLGAILTNTHIKISQHHVQS